MRTLSTKDRNRRDVVADDEAAQRYLEVLRDGNEEQRIEARFRLARVFEKRGMLAEASELYESNVRAGVRDAGLYMHLASLYRRQDRLDEAGAALAFAEQLGATSDERVRRAVRAVPLLPAAGPERRGRRMTLLAISSVAVLFVGGAFTTCSPSPLALWSAGDAEQAATAQLAAAEATPADPIPTEAPVSPTATAEPAVVLAAQADAVDQPAGCTFVLGFAELRQAIGPDKVGECIEDQYFDGDGDGHQLTTNGELVWRKADNRSAFTDGATTWMIGPNGLQSRSNEDRFAWEPFPLPPVLPGSVLPARRIVSYYGNPLSQQMGILGEIPPDQMIARLRQQVEAYAAADPRRPFQPALELVAIVAQAGAGADGLYRLRMDSELIEEVAQWADQNNFLLILDIQIGRSSVAPEIRSLLPFLKRPNVHLALDPEFTMRPTEKPGEVIGTHDAEEVNVAIDMLAELVSAENLPPKVLLVHRFTERMLTNYRKIKADSRVQVAVVMDGFGAPPLKIDHYNAFVANQRVQYTGIKLFYKQDKPLMSPKDVVDLEPTPDVIIYQ